jgi:hypothetical protein
MAVLALVLLAAWLPQPGTERAASMASRHGW